MPLPAPVTSTVLPANSRFLSMAVMVSSSRLVAETSCGVFIGHEHRWIAPAQRRARHMKFLLAAAHEHHAPDLAQVLQRDRDGAAIQRMIDQLAVFIHEMAEHVAD